MEILKFTLSGRGATFTNNSSNAIITTYPHIHKVAICGLIGAIVGIEKDRNTPMKFYEELKDLKIAIVPKKIKFNINQTIYINTTGHYNSVVKKVRGSYKNIPCTSVLNSDELINPSWELYIVNTDNNKHFPKLKDYVLNSCSHFSPYFGKKKWFASISNVSLVDGIYTTDFIDEKINGLFPLRYFELEEDDDDDDIFGLNRQYFEFFLPVGLSSETKCYEQEKIAITNDIIKNNNEPIELLKIDDEFYYTF